MVGLLNSHSERTLLLKLPLSHTATVLGRRALMIGAREITSDSRLLSEELRGMPSGIRACWIATRGGVSAHVVPWKIFCEDGRFEARERTCESLVEGDCAEVCSIVSKVSSGRAFAKSEA